MDQEATIRAFELMEQYGDHPMDLADASLIAAAESLRTTKVFTLNRADFQRYRVRRGTGTSKWRSFAERNLNRDARRRGSKGQKRSVRSSGRERVEDNSHGLLVRYCSNRHREADNRQPYDFLGLFVISNDDAFPGIDTGRSLWLAETQVKRVGIVIVFPLQRLTFLSEHLYSFHTILLYEAGRLVKYQKIGHSNGVTPKAML